jgi:conjugal transfer pilus assembly protein TrbC
VIWVVSCLLLTLPPLSEEIAQFSEEAGKRIDEEAAAFLKNLYQQTTPESPCKKCLPLTSVQPAYNLMVFMSFSVPLESWKDWSYALERRGGVFVLRGLPENSFQTLAQKVKELRDAGINAPIYIDPDACERYRIEMVPSIVFAEGEKFHKIVGNIRMEKAFDLLAD